MALTTCVSDDASISMYQNSHHVDGQARAELSDVVRDALLRLQSLLWPSLSPCESAVLLCEDLKDPKGSWWRCVASPSQWILKPQRRREGRAVAGGAVREHPEGSRRRNQHIGMVGTITGRCDEHMFPLSMWPRGEMDLEPRSEEEPRADVFFHAEQNDTAFIQLRVWGIPIDVDASSRAIWVVCEKEYMTNHGIQMEHFLFAKWGWSMANNHVWWHMMRGGNVIQLDADDDAMWGLDGDGSILWRPAGDVGKHSRWMRIDGPPNVALKLIAADNDERGTWLWCIDDEDRIWRRDPGDYHEKNRHDKWTDRDPEGLPYWSKPDGSVLKDLKANMGFALAIDDHGHLLRRYINGSCCMDSESPVHCWCSERGAPRLSAVTDNGDHGLGFYMPSLQHKIDDTWTASANRWLQQLTSRDDGHNADSPHEASQYFSYYCDANVDHCGGLDTSITDFLEGWRKVSRKKWETWDWGTLKSQWLGGVEEIRFVPGEICQLPLKHYGAFRERFMQNLFCCARHLQTPEDPKCEQTGCRAYDMTCPGSKLLTSDAWPASSKSLFEPVPGKEGTAVWVFRRKCTPSARQAILEKVKRIIDTGAEEIQSENLDQLVVALHTFVGNLANGSYGYGHYTSEWDHLYQDFRAVSSVQREGYLTYAATLEVVGRQQVGLPTTFAEDYHCMRQVSFLEQLAFIAQHIQTDTWLKRTTGEGRLSRRNGTHNHGLGVSNCIELLLLAYKA
ncbi:unnamed protein product [Durusdinium trenchii]|uniref:Uncharacterized protein n=1 Tax=Durusdinium trenchii TaxID=1381693 RepID=A0ABP0KMJ3_9DINO